MSRKFRHKLEGFSTNAGPRIISFELPDKGSFVNDFWKLQKFLSTFECF